MAALKFPKLLRNQYLSHSPIWKAYMNNENLPASIYSINQKLFSAQIISDLAKNPQNKEIQKNYMKFSKQLIEREALTQQLKGKFQFDSSIYKKVQAYFQSRRQNNNQYQLKAIAKAYQDNQQMDQSNKLNELDSKKNDKFFWYSQHLVNISKRKKLDELDLQLMLTVSLQLEQVEILEGLIDLNISNIMAIQYLRKIILKSIAEGQGTNIPLLQKILNRLQMMSSSQSSQIVKKTLSVLCSIMDSKDVKYDIGISTIVQLNQHRQIINAKDITYLQITTHQYLLYLDWLAVKCIFAPTNDSLIMNLQQFCHKLSQINLLAIIIQGSNSKSDLYQIRRIQKLHMRVEMAKLQIITYLYNQLTGLTAQNKLNQFLGKGLAFEKISNLRNIKLDREKTVEKAFAIMSKIGDSLQTNKSILWLFSLIQSIQYVQRLVNAKPNYSFYSNAKSLQLSSSKMHQIIQKLLTKASQYQMILFNDSQLRSMRAIFGQVISTNGTTSSTKLNQFYSKISKKIQNQKESSKIHTQDTIQSIKSASELKHIWEYFKNQKQKNNEQYEQLRNSVFLLKSTSANNTNNNSIQKSACIEVLLRKFFE